MQRRSRLGQVTAVVGLAVLLVGRGPGSAQGEYDPYLVSSYSEALQEILPEHNWTGNKISSATTTSRVT